MAEGTLRKRDTLVLRGRLVFCDAFILGRLGKMALHGIAEQAMQFLLGNGDPFYT